MLDFKSELNTVQYTAVSWSGDSLLVIAGAGSGKTRTIVYRLAWLLDQGISPESLLLLTFTKKAAQEMLQRAAKLLDYHPGSIQGGTFHAFAYSILRQWPPTTLNLEENSVLCQENLFKVNTQSYFSILDSTDAISIIRQCRDNLQLAKGEKAFPKTQTVAKLLSKARNKEMALDELISHEASHLLQYLDSLEKLAEEYSRYKRNQCLLDYDDLLFELENLLLSNPTAAKTLRSRFKYILVDEYQDTNSIQARLVRLLAGAPDQQTNLNHVMAVGDEAQSIYAFRGANIQNILNFTNTFPNSQALRLEENYRSTKPILDVANAILVDAQESFHKKLFTRQLGGMTVRHFITLTEWSQANIIVKRVEDCLDQYNPNQIAILFRAGYQSYNLEMALQRQGIFFQKYGGIRYSEAAHIKDLISWARLLLNPLDMPAFTRIAQSHNGIGPKTISKLYTAFRASPDGWRSKSFKRFPNFQEDLAFLENLRRDLDSLNPSALLFKILEHYRSRLELLYPDDWPKRLQALEEIIAMSGVYTELDLFITDLALDTPEENDDKENSITLSTVHSAKGLEWDVVFIIDLVENRFPVRHASNDPEVYEEERRLLYVACTRARKVLELYSPLRLNNPNNSGQEIATISPFIQSIPKNLLEIFEENRNGQLCQKNQFTANTSSQTAGQFKSQYCTHRIFGRGKIIRIMNSDSLQVEFPGFGLKTILMEYLQPED